MTKQTKTIRAIGAKPTQEQLEAQAKRAFIQKRNALAEGILYNAIQSSHGTRIDENGQPDFKPAVKAAIEAADAMMEQLYSVSITTEEKAEE